MKFDIKKLANGKVFGLLIAGFAAVAAFSTEIGNQQKEKTIKNLTDTTTDLLDRVSKLENK